VYQAGYPEYEFVWNTYHDGFDYHLNINLKQIQMNAPVFSLPVEISVHTVFSDSIMQLGVTGANEQYHFSFAEEITDVVFDPRYRILKTVTETPSAAVTSMLPQDFSVKVYPNPMGESARLDFFLFEGGDVHLEIFDVTGRRVGKIIRRGLPDRWNSIVIKNQKDGVNLNRNGVYFFRLRSSSQNASGKLLVVK
jgi:hypothetical protein